MRNFLLTTAVLGAIADSLLNPNRWLWRLLSGEYVWFGWWWHIPLGLFVLYWLVIIHQSATRSRDDQERTRYENWRRSQLTEEDYKLDKWQGSFNHRVDKWTYDNGEYQPAETTPVPKPPEPVPGFWEGFWKQMRDE